jgi:hypothetical protein
MIKINWNQDDRNTDVNKYLVNPNSDKRSRLRAFRTGWANFLKKKNNNTLDKVTWNGLGRVYASILGDIPLDQRKNLYWLLLSQFVTSDKVKHWTDEQRQETLWLVEEA